MAKISATAMLTRITTAAAIAAFAFGLGERMTTRGGSAPPGGCLSGSVLQKVNVAELMPAVAVGQRRGVRALEQRAPRDRLEHQQVAGVGLVPAREQRVDGADAAVGGDDEAGPAGGGVDGAVLVGRGLERADHGGADGDDPAAALSRAVDAVGGAAGDAEAL